MDNQSRTSAWSSHSGSILFVPIHVSMLLFPSNQNDEDDRVFKVISP